MTRPLIAACSFALLALSASAADAAKVLQLSALDTTGSVTGTFGDTGIAGGLFEDVFTFNLPAPGVLGGTISTSLTSPANNIDFTLVSLNGRAFTLSPTGIVEIGVLDPAGVATGLQRLVVRGRSGGSGSYAGTLSFSITGREGGGAVPEPASWALMITGFGGLGATLRARRRRESGLRAIWR
jgi:opacity protein-like surface antigen